LAAAKVQDKEAARTLGWVNSPLKTARKFSLHSELSLRTESKRRANRADDVMEHVTAHAFRAYPSLLPSRAPEVALATLVTHGVCVPSDEAVAVPKLHGANFQASYHVSGPSPLIFRSTKSPFCSFCCVESRALLGFGADAAGRFSGPRRTLTASGQ
jgi:hypothetical protein